MAIPDFQSVMRPVLQTVSDGHPRALADVREVVKEAKIVAGSAVSQGDLLG